MESHSPFRDVLIVDDDPLVRGLLHNVLTVADYRVREAENGSQALRMVAEQCPYFLVTDWVMPQLSGPELCRKLRSLDLPHYVYTILLTVRGRQQDLAEGFLAGADDYLTKPLHAQELLTRLHAGRRVLELESRLQRQAHYDWLTGLLNRARFNELLQVEWNRALRFDSSLCYLMIDIDHFKQVNDQLGHAAGDEVLKSVATTLQQACRPGDLACRYGGEEFAVVLPQHGRREGRAWACELQQAVESAGARVGLKEPLRISVGIAERTSKTSDLDSLFRQADQALYRAKQNGRNRCEFDEFDEFDESDGDESTRTVVLQN